MLISITIRNINCLMHLFFNFYLFLLFKILILGYLTDGVIVVSGVQFGGSAAPYIVPCSL